MIDFYTVAGNDYFWCDPTQPDADLTAKLVVSCFNRGLVILSAGTFKNVIRILSPLVITNEQLDKGLNILEEELMKLTSMAEPAI